MVRPAKRPGDEEAAEIATQAQLRRQARLLARIKFGGELGSLAQLLGDAQAQRKLAIHNAGAGAGALVSTLEGIRPKIGSAYDAADAQRAQGGAEADQGLAGLSGPVIDAIRASRARESQAQTAASAGDRAAALTDVGNREVGARAGAIAETRQAQQAYRTDSQKIFGQLLGIKSRQGDFIAATTADLSQKQRDQAIKEANLDVSRKALEETAQYHSDTLDQRAQDRASREAIARANRRAQNRKDRSKQGKSSFMTRDQQNNFIDDVDAASNWAQQLKAAGQNGKKVRQALLQGVNQTTATGKKITIPAYPKQVVNTAMDLAYLGRIGSENRHRAHKRGIKIPDYWRQ